MSSTLLRRLPWPDGWARPKRLKWIISVSYLGLVSAATFVVGVAGLFEGKFAAGIFVTYGSLLCFLGTMHGILMRVIVRRTAVDAIHISTVPASDEAALVIPYSRCLFWAIFLFPALLLVGVAPLAVGMIWAVLVEPDVGNVVMAVLCTICGAYLLLFTGEFLRRKIVCGYVVLSPTGIYHRSWALTSFVLWEHVLAVRSVEGEGPVITVQVTANADGWSRRTSRYWKQSELGIGLDLMVRGMYLSVDPALLYHALQFYLNNPCARTELSGDAAVWRLKRADIPVSAQRPLGDPEVRSELKS